MQIVTTVGEPTINFLHAHLTHMPYRRNKACDDFVEQTISYLTVQI